MVMLTYASSLDSPRHNYAKITAKSLAKNLNFSGHINWHIADDGSHPDHLHNIPWPSATYSVVDRKGYGASYNQATQVLHNNNEYFLMVEDDWELLKPLDLDPLVQALDEGLNCIRLGYLGWTQDFYGKVEKYAGQSFLVFDPDSAEPHVWAGHPRIESVAFQRAVGPWPEGIDAGTTEFIVAKRNESRAKVAWPLDIGANASQQYASLFAHIGAVQAREDQLEVIDAL